MGLRLRVPAGHRIATLNTVCVPKGVDEAKVRRRLLDEPGIEIAGGFGPLAGKVFRVGVMGPLATEDNVQFFLRSLAGRGTPRATRFEFIRFFAACAMKGRRGWPDFFRFTNNG